MRNKHNNFSYSNYRPLNIFNLRTKLIILFVMISSIPLGILAFLLWEQSQELGTEIIKRTHGLEQKTTDVIESYKKTLYLNLYADIDELMNTINSEIHKDTNTNKVFIKEHLENATTNIIILTILMIMLVFLISKIVASRFAYRINSTTNGLLKFQNGEREFRFNSNKNDEIGTLCNAFDQIADIIVNNEQGLLIITDLECRIIYGNNAYLTYIDNKLKSIKGMQYERISILGKFNPLYCHLNNIECPIHHVTANNTYLKGTADKYYDSHGKPMGFIIQIFDVTELISAQKKTEEKFALLATFFSTSPDILWYKNINGKYLFANDRFLSISGKEMHEIQDHEEHEFMPKDLIDIHTNSDSMVKQYASHVVSQNTIQFADGHSEIVETVRVATFDVYGEIIGILGAARDVSERVATGQQLLKTQSELRAAIDNANRANAVKTNFLAHMSHEIRTPMNAVLGLSKIILHKLSEDNPPWEEICSYINEIEISGSHLSNLFNDLLEMSKIELGEITISREDFEFKHILTNVCTMAEQNCKYKDIQFCSNIETLDNLQFSSDPLRIKQVINTLLSTAIKYSPNEGIINFDIFSVEYENHATHFQFTIKSSSTEITPEIITSLFSAFDCGRTEVAKNFNSTTLGLFISQSIVNLLGGKIEISKNSNNETVFTFNIWLDDPTTQTIPKHALNTNTLKGKRILLVDDVEINRIIVLEMLDDMYLKVDEAVDGMKAFEKFTTMPENYYDLILMDIQMPLMGGYECTKRIRALERSDAKSIPIVALSANSFKEDIEESFNSGMNEHLSKPVNYINLLSTLVKQISA